MTQAAATWDDDVRNVEAGIAYAVSRGRDDPGEAVKIADQLLAAADDATKLRIYLALLPYAEFHARRQDGLAPGHATGMDDLFFRYAAADFATFQALAARHATARPTDPQAVMADMVARFCAGERAGAQSLLDRLRPGAGNIWEAVTFKPAYYAQLAQATDAQLVAGLPPVVDLIRATFAAEPIAFLACDFAYFTAFAVPMLRSLAAVGAGAQAHVHIMDADAEQQRQASEICRALSGLTIALTVETPGVRTKGGEAARCYYHAVRFIRFHALLRETQHSLWLMDVDALFQRDPRALYAMRGEAEIALRARPGRLEPWNQFNACIVGATPTPASLRYFRLVAAYIADLYQRDRLRWGADQLAMYGAFMHLADNSQEPRVAFLDDSALDYEHRDDGVVWCNSGTDKFGGSDPHRDRYRALLARYMAAA